MINKIEFTNIKGHSASHTLHPLTLITGDNFAGKTAIITAIILARQGFHPALGKTNAATFQLSSGDKMSVELNYDAHTIWRTWKQSGKTVMSQKSGVDNAPPLPVFFADAFIQTTPAARLAMLAEASTSNADWNELDAAIKRSGLTTEGETVLERSASALEQLAAQATYSRARKTGFEKSLSAIQELNGTPVPRPVNRLATIANLIDEIKSSTADAHRLIHVTEAATDAAEELETLPATTDQGDMQAAVNGLTNAAIAHSNARRVEGNDNTALNEALLYTETAKVEPVDYAPEPDVDFMQWGYRANAALNEAKQSVKIASVQLADLQKQEQQLNDLTACPTCKAQHDGWKAIAACSIKQQIEDALFATVASDLKLSDATEELNHYNIALQRKKSLKDYNEFLIALDDVKKLKAKMITHEETVAHTEQELNKWKALVDQYEKNVATAARRKELEATIEKGREADQTLPATMETIGERKAKLEAEQAAHEAEEPARLAYAAFLASYKQMEQARKEAEIEEENLNKILSMQAEIKATAAATLKSFFEPIVEIAHYWSANLLPTPLDLHPTTGQIGRWQDETHFLPFAVLSGAEQIIATASLQAALAERGKGVLIIDEMGRLSKKIRQQFLQRIEKAIEEKRISQAIVIDPDASAYVAWNIITV